MYPSDESDRLPSPEMREAFERDGFFVVRSGFRPEEIEPVRAACLAAWQAKHDEGDLLERALVRPFLPEIHLQSAAVAEFCRHPIFVELARGLIGSEVDQTWNQACFKAPDKGELTRFPVHQDGQFAEVTHPETGFACFIALRPLSRANGSLGFARGHHRKTLEHHWSETDSWWSCAVDDDAMVYPELAVGDFVVYHPKTPHGGEPNGTDAAREAFLVAFNEPEVRLVETGELFGNQRPLLRAGVLAPSLTTA